MEQRPMYPEEIFNDQFCKDPLDSSASVASCREKHFSEYQFSNALDYSSAPAPNSHNWSYDYTGNYAPVTQQQVAPVDGVAYGQHPLSPFETHSRTSSTNSTSSAPAVIAQPNPPITWTQPSGFPMRKPKICTTFWEDEGTTCYQIRHNNILVSRSEDTNYINGTKLLNVIGMTRGKRDGILKTEKNKNVVKVGSINLKGVWIPFERAYEIARNEGVDDALYPLFVEDIKGYFETKGRALKCDDSDPPPMRKSPRSRKQKRADGFEIFDQSGENWQPRA
ncbi:hypothetical protein DICA3_C11562 [Diutina catenulata]